jgi:hypothetical protein
MPISDQDKQRLQYIATLIEANKLAEAKNHLSDLIKNSPPSAPAWYLVSLTLTEIDKQRTALERALAIDPNYAPAQKALKSLKLAPRSSQQVSNQTAQPNKSNSSNIPLPIALLSVVLVFLIVGGGVFLVVKPDAVSDVKTLVATVRATPIGTPLVFSTTEVRGEATVEMHAGENDLQARGRKDFTLRGISTYRKGSELVFAIEDERTSEYWEFIFNLPNYADGRTYDDGLTINMGYVIGYQTESIPVRETIQCPQIKSSYKIEKQNTDFVFTLSRTCNTDSRQWLDAVFHFRPNDSLTPTPTILPDLLFDFKPYFGTIRLEMNSSVGDSIGEGKGDIVLETTGELQRTGESSPYAYKFIAATATDRWELSFWSPSIQLQQPYEVQQVVRYSGHTRAPEMSIKHPVRIIQSCSTVSGRFTVEQQSPSIIISFEQHCYKDPTNVLRGRLIFTPTTTNTPTPTLTLTRIPPTPIPRADSIVPTWTPIPNTKLTSLLGIFGNPTMGRVEVNAEWLGRATRVQALQGSGEAGRGDANPTFDQFVIILKEDDKTHENWVFTFQGKRLFIGQTYQHAFYDNVGARSSSHPSMSISKGRDGTLCEDHDGSFRFDQQGDDLVVTFTQWCTDNEPMSLQGTIRFSPDEK